MYRMTTKAIALTLLILVAGDLWAVPAAPLEVKVRQPDGMSFTAIARGDEYANWVETRAGHTIVKSGETWYYAQRDGQGGLEATADRVGSLGKEQLNLMERHIAPTPHPDAYRRTTPRRIPDIAQRASAGSFGAPGAPVAQKVLTILVDYTDQAFSYSDNSFRTRMYGANKSVKQFFLQNSYGNFTIQAARETQGTSNDGIVHISRMVQHPNPGNDNDKKRAEAAAIIPLVDDFVDFSAFDTNADGAISPTELSIVMILAGYEASYTATPEAPNVWGVRAGFSPVELDGVNVSDFTMFGETHKTQGQPGHQATIGIMAHELGHLMLGLPDLYDTDADNGDSWGIGVWGLMSGGSWNVDGGFLGDSPAHLSAWSKVKTNFTVPTDILTSQNSVGFPKADANAEAARIWIDKYRAWEYFLIENRQRSGYDVGLPGSGLLIWHVDERQDGNANENRKLVDLEEADGLEELDDKTDAGDSGDPFPGATNNTAFNNGSNPNSRSNDRGKTNIAVTGISSSSANMSAKVSVPSENSGDNVSYFRLYNQNVGYQQTTAWAGVNVRNNTEHDRFDGVDIYINDEKGAMVDIYFHRSITGGVLGNLIHSETGFVADPGWNRLLLATPKGFPLNAQRGVVVKVVNDSYGFPIALDTTTSSGRSFIDNDGMGTFFNYQDRDVLVRTLLSSETASNTYTVGGTVTGLQGNGLVLQLNCGEEKSINNNGAFTFATALDNGSNYVVGIKTQPGPSGQSCAVSNGSGTVPGANVTNVAVTCATEALPLRAARSRAAARVADGLAQVQGGCG